MPSDNPPLASELESPPSGEAPDMVSPSATSPPLSAATGAPELEPEEPPPDELATPMAPLSSSSAGLAPPEVLPAEVPLPDGVPPLRALGAWDPHAAITTATASETIPKRAPAPGS